MFWPFLAGNVIYYISGIALAFAFKDNRAFCKYLCPVTVFLKPMSYFSVLHVHCDESKCVHCGKCLRVCPMDVEVNKESRKRKNGTECIHCYECTKVCPKKALRWFFWRPNAKMQNTNRILPPRDIFEWAFAVYSKYLKYRRCPRCSFKHKLHYYSYIQQRIFSIKRKMAAKNYDSSFLFIGIVTYRCGYFHHFLKKYPQ